MPHFSRGQFPQLEAQTEQFKTAFNKHLEDIEKEFLIMQATKDAHQSALDEHLTEFQNTIQHITSLVHDLEQKKQDLLELEQRVSHLLPVLIDLHNKISLPKPGILSIIFKLLAFFRRK